MNNIESVVNTVKESGCIKGCKILSGEDFIKLSEQVTHNHSASPIRYNYATYIIPKNEHYECHSKISINKRTISLERTPTIIRDSRWLEFFNFNMRIKSFVEEKSRRYNLWFMLEKKEPRLKAYIAKTRRKFRAYLPIRYDKRDSNYRRLKDFYFNSKIKDFVYHCVSTISKT